MGSFRASAVARSRAPKFRDRLAFRALLLVRAVARRIPLATGQRIGSMLGGLGFTLLRRERRKAIDHVGLAFPDSSPAERERIVREMFRHLGCSLFEICWIPNLDPDKLAASTRFENIEHLHQALEGGRGVLLFTAHCGNWEWLGASLAIAEFPINTIAREMDDSRLNEFIMSTRALHGLRTIERGSEMSGRAILQALRSGGILAMLIDQNIVAENVEVDFFGQPALTPVGPARLAIRSGAAAIAGFIERRDGIQHIRFEAPVFTSRDDDPGELTRLMTEAIERQVRKRPEQWVWMHKRWRKRKP